MTKPPIHHARCIAGVCLDGSVEFDVRATAIGYALFANQEAAGQGATVAQVRRATGVVTAIPPPPGCRPLRVSDGAGLALLVCNGEPATIYALGADGAAVGERALPVAATAIDAITFASDGTAIVRATWRDPKSRRAFVRSPAPLGSPSAWREVDVTGAAGVRVLPGGRVLLLRPLNPDEPPRTGVTRAFGLDPPEPPSGLVEVALDGPLGVTPLPTFTLYSSQSIVDVSIEDGQIVAWLRSGWRPNHFDTVGEPASRARGVPSVLLTDGTLRRKDGYLGCFEREPMSRWALESGPPPCR